MSTTVAPRAGEKQQPQVLANWLRKFGPYLISPIVIIILWIWISHDASMGKFVPTPEVPGAHAVELFREGFHGKSIYTHLFASLSRTAMGFGLAVLTGIPLGLLMGRYEILNKPIGLVFSFLRPIPPIAFIPLAVIYFGIGQTSKVLLIYYASFLYVVLNTQAGVKTVPDLLIRAGQSLGMSQMRLFTKVILPGSTPHILSGLRTALGISWPLVVAAELVAADAGLGYTIMEAANFFDLPTVYVGILIVGLIGVALDMLILALQAKLLHWQGRG